MANESLYSLLTKIINKISLIKTKARKIDQYWCEVNQLTNSVSITNSTGYTVTAGTVNIYHSILEVNLTITPSSQKSVGTHINSKVCTITINSSLVAECIPSGEVPSRAEAVFSGNAPIANLSLCNFNRTNDNTITADVRLGSIYGIALSTSGASVRFYSLIPRSMPS